MANFQNTDYFNDNKATVLETILTLVRSGMSIVDAVKAQGVGAPAGDLKKVQGSALNWYYRTLSKADRAPILAARVEYETEQEQVKGVNAGAAHIIMSADTRREYRRVCGKLGITVTERINTLVLADLSALSPALANLPKRN